MRVSELLIYHITVNAFDVGKTGRYFETDINVICRKGIILIFL